LVANRLAAALLFARSGTCAKQTGEQFGQRAANKLSKARQDLDNIARELKWIAPDVP
jgi:hypothetical protein